MKHKNWCGYPSEPCTCGLEKQSEMTITSGMIQMIHLLGPDRYYPITQFGYLYTPILIGACS